MLVCGPSFGSGRYGYACGLLAREAVQARHSRGLWHGSREPGCRRGGGRRLRRADDARTWPGCARRFRRSRRSPLRLGAGEELGPPEVEGYLPRGLRRNERAGATGAAGRSTFCSPSSRGHPHRGRRDLRPRPAAAARRVDGRDEARARHRGRLRPAGKSGRLADDSRGPRGCGTRSATSAIARGRPLRIGSRRLRRRRPPIADPNRLVPLDAARALEREGRIGAIHDAFYTTTGNGTPVAVSTKFGQEIADELKEAGVEAVDPVGHLRDGHALRGNARQGDRAVRDTDGVRHGSPDDRDDDRREPGHSRSRDHEPLRGSRAEPGRGARPADEARRAGARDARDGRRARDCLGGRAVTACAGVRG